MIFSLITYGAGNDFSQVKLIERPGSLQ
jgi:hypothetical protein